MSYCFMQFNKQKSNAKLIGAYNHNYRQYDVSNADPSKKKMNEELIALPKGEDFVSMVEKKISESPAYAGTHRPRKDAVKCLEFMLTYNAKTVSADFNEEEWKKENVKWLQDKFGKENVISAVLHKDEATPHIHAMVIPMVDGKLNAYHFTAGKAALQDLQNSYGEYMGRVGLERGLRNTQAEHTDISKFYAALNKTISVELPAIDEKETAFEYRERVNKIYIDSNLKHYGEKNKDKRKLDEMKTKLINEMQNKDQIISDLKRDVEKLKIQASITEKEHRQAKAFEDILKGVKYGYFKTEKESEVFMQQMKDIATWEQEREKGIELGEHNDR